MKYSISYLILFVTITLLPLGIFANESSLHVSKNAIYEPQADSLFTPNEIKWLEKKQPITYVYDPDWAPFEWKNNIGKHTGIIRDILNLIMKKTGIELIPVNSDTWEESVEMVKTKKADMYSAITKNKAREKYLNFTTRDIYTYPAVLITKFEDKKVYIDIDESFKDKKIGIVKSSGLGQYIKDTYPNLQYVELPTTKDGFYSLRDNKIDFFAINIVTAKYFIEKQEFDDLKLALKLDYLYYLKIALRKDLPAEIISIIDKSLSRITEKELNDIFNKWTEIYTVHHTNWKLILQISGFLFFVIIFLIWSNRRLNQQVEVRTKELTDKNIELSNAVKEIKTLRGIIPICSYCHSIRDDEGAWDRVEAYISRHSEAEFSHGICPNCFNKVRNEYNLTEK